MPLARGAERLVRDQPLAVLLVEHAHPPAEDDGAGLAARGGCPGISSPRAFVISRWRPATATRGAAFIVRKQVGGHGRIDVHALEGRRA